MNLDFIRGIQVLIIAFLSYIVTVTFAGWFESFVAKQVGDDTPADLGFLTLNPLDHFNVFGFAAVLWTIFYGNLLPFKIIPGWGRYIPLLPDTMQGKNLKLRAFIEFIGRSMGHLIILMVISMIGAICGVVNLYTLEPIIMSAHPTSFMESVGSLIFFIYYQNLVLFVIHFVLGLFKFLIHFYAPQFHEITIQRILMGFVLLTLGIIILGPLLEKFVYMLIGLIQLIFVKAR